MASIDEIIRQATEKAAKKAEAKAKAKAEAIVESAERDKESRAKMAKEAREKAEKEAREKKNKAATTIATEFIREIAEPFVRLMQREDADKLTDIDIILRPRKSDLSGSFCAVIHHGGAKYTVTHRPSLEEMVGSKIRHLSKLKEQGKLLFTTTEELAERVVEVQNENARIRKEHAEEIAQLRAEIARLQGEQQHNAQEQHAGIIKVGA